MALTSDEVPSTNNDEVNSTPSDKTLPVDNEEGENIVTPLSTIREQPSSSVRSDEINKENIDTKRLNRLKTRSVSFAPTVEEFEIPSRASSRRPVDFIDALVESYKIQTSASLFPLTEEKKYVPKTTRTRLNPNWREHRTRHLMNKLESLSLWDREEELKISQAQFLREQKLEQIQDRQRNHDLCLNLMRQRHESEIESAVLLDRLATGINEENTKATIARAMHLASPANVLAYNLPTPPHSLKRQEVSEFKTPIGRYRNFETNMNNKVDKINQKLQPDREIMRAYSPYRTSIPPTVVPLFSETYSALLAIPDTYSSNRYNQHGVASYLHQPHHASSSDYETRLRSYSNNRDVRVPLKEQMNDTINYDENNEYYNSSRMTSSPSKRTTNLISSTASSLYDSSTLANTPREYSLLHSRQPISNSIHHRSLNDDLNAITCFSNETSKQILHSIIDSSDDVLTHNRSSSVPTNKRVEFVDQDNDDENFN